MLLSMTAVVAKMRHDPHPPCDLTGVILPSASKSKDMGGLGHSPSLYYDSNFMVSG